MGKKAAGNSTDIKAKHVDIREVRVNYVSTKEKPFDIRFPVNVASFFRSVAVDNSREQFMAMYLDASHCVISYSLIAIGSARQVSGSIFGLANAILVVHHKGRYVALKPWIEPRRSFLFQCHNRA